MDEEHDRPSGRPSKENGTALGGRRADFFVRAAPSDPDNRDRVIALLYDVALDPTQFDTLLNGWEEAMAPRRQQGVGFDDLEGDETLSAHFIRADAVLDKLDNTPAREDVSLPEVYRNTAAFMVDRQMRIIATTARARTLGEVAQAQTLAQLGLEAVDLGALANAVGRLIDHPESDATLLRLHDQTKSGAQGADPAVTRDRAPARSRGPGVVLHLRPHQHESGQRVVIVVASSVAWPDGFDALLTSAFGLTGAEVDVTRLLVDAATPREIASARGRSVDTVRVQIKAILAKTEAHSQVELVRLILSMMDMSRLGGNSDTPAPYVVSVGNGGLQPLPFHTTFGTDGRRLDYLTFGDPKAPRCFISTLITDWPAGLPRPNNARRSWAFG